MEVRFVVHLTPSEEEVVGRLVDHWKKTFGHTLSIEACLGLIVKMALRAAIDVQHEREQYRNN